ncbi:MAG: hypothetical protein WC554_13860, partial [Clostridia bacterium]
YVWTTVDKRKDTEGEVQTIPCGNLRLGAFTGSKKVIVAYLNKFTALKYHTAEDFIFKSDGQVFDGETVINCLLNIEING